MSELVVAVFGDEFKAEEVRLELRKKEAAHLIDLEDAVVLVRNRTARSSFTMWLILPLEAP